MKSTDVFIFQLISAENGTRTKPFIVTRDEFTEMLVKMRDQQGEIYEKVRSDYVLTVLNLSALQGAKETAQEGQNAIGDIVSVIPIFTVENFLSISLEKGSDHEEELSSTVDQ